MIKLFEQWLNENEVEKVLPSLSSFFNNTWTELRFPWEAEIIEKLDELKEVLTSIDNEFEVNRYRGSSNANYNLNIKFYEWPDFDKIAEEYGMSEDEVNEEWYEYLSRQLQDFVDGLEYDWLNDTWQSGRSGGWLTLETTSDYDVEKIKERTADILEEYEDEVCDYDSITAEELAKMKASLTASRFGLSDNGKAEEIKYLKECKDDLNRMIDEELEKAKNLKEGLEEVEKFVKAGQTGLVQGFEEEMSERND
jgi:hypothetical protein